MHQFIIKSSNRYCGARHGIVDLGSWSSRRRWKCTLAFAVIVQPLVHIVRPANKRSLAQKVDHVLTSQNISQ